MVSKASVLNIKPIMKNGYAQIVYYKNYSRIVRNSFALSNLIPCVVCLQAKSNTCFISCKYSIDRKRQTVYLYTVCLWLPGKLPVPVQWPERKKGFPDGSERKKPYKLPPKNIQGSNRPRLSKKTIGILMQLPCKIIQAFAFVCSIYNSATI